MKFNLEYIKSAVGGKFSANADKTREIECFFTDSRTPSKEKIFLAIRGERVDGNSFVPALVEQGYCALTDDVENLKLDGDVIYVKDVRNALQLLARYYRQNELKDITFVGITGSVGKTTTKEMVALALSSGLDVHKTIGNFNSQIGLPQTVLACEKEVDCAVVELGMNMPNEMERISRCAIPDISIITNIGYSHIENLGTREAIRDEKLKIACHSKKDSILILNGDEPLLREVDYGEKRVYFVSVQSKDCQSFGENITENEQGITFDAVILGEKIKVSLPVIGNHFVSNALFALTAAKLLGLDLNKAAQSLSQYESDGKRQFIYEKDGHKIISDCYNASPESMKAALSVLKSSKGRRIAVLGDMLELGSQSEKLHSLVGQYVNGAVDVLVTFGDMARFIAESTNVSEKYSFSLEERNEMEELLSKIVKSGDTVLYKASNGIKLGDSIV